MNNESRMTPAALRAALNGDVVNTIAASTLGGIEAQEAAGQREIVREARLPIQINGGSRADFEAVGFQFGKQIDDIFMEATLPPGWTKEATEHSMWSEIKDERGRVRVSIFYKAAFYDRSAHMGMERYYRIQRHYDGDQYVHIINADGAEVWRSETYGVRPSDREALADFYNRERQADDAAQAWINENYPDWRNPAAYW